MARRKPYSGVRKQRQDRPAHVQGQSDVVYKVMQCLHAPCQEWIVTRLVDIGPGFRLRCNACGHELHDGGQTHLFDYELVNRDAIEESGSFVVDHGEYVRGSANYKYCILCYALRPLDSFDRHASRKQSGRQGECTACKRKYNGIKNKTRIPEQHREASERRRLLGLLAGDTTRVDRDDIRDRFQHSCFACGVPIDGQNEAFDHTLPLRLLWPLETRTATLLCVTCNGNKGGQWPSDFYDDQQLRRLAVLTDVPYQRLAGEPTINEEALALVREDPDSLLNAWIHHPEDLRDLRRRVREVAGVDIFEGAKNVPSYLD